MTIATMKMHKDAAIRSGIASAVSIAVYALSGQFAVEQFQLTGLQGNLLGFALAWVVFGVAQLLFSPFPLAERIYLIRRLFPISMIIYMCVLPMTAILSLARPDIPQETLPLCGAFLIAILSLLTSRLAENYG